MWHGNAEKPLALKWTLRIILLFTAEAPQENPAVGNKGAWYCRDAKQTLALYPSLEPAKRLMESSAPHRHHHHHQDICMELFTSQDRLCEDAPREKKKGLHIFQLILLAHKQRGIFWDKESTLKITKNKNKTLSADKLRVNFKAVSATYQTRETHSEMFRSRKQFFRSSGCMATPASERRSCVVMRAGCGDGGHPGWQKFSNTKGFSMSKPISGNALATIPYSCLSPPVVPAGLERLGLEPRQKQQLEAWVRSAAAARIIHKTLKMMWEPTFFRWGGRKPSAFVLQLTKALSVFLRSRRHRGVIFKATQRVTSLLFIVLHLGEGRVWSTEEIIASSIT